MKSRLAILAVATTIGTLCTVTPAFAADPHGPVPATTVGPKMCEPDYSYSTSNAAPMFLDVKKNYGGPGITLSISVAAGVTVSAQVSGSVTFEESAIIASAKEQVGLQFGASFTTTATFSGSWTVPGNVSEGWVAIGARADRMNWIKQQQMGNCTWRTVGSGTANLPWKYPYFHHS